MKNVYSMINCTATWPSGKAEACKAFTPGSNPGVAFFLLKIQPIGLQTITNLEAAWKILN